MWRPIANVGTCHCCVDENWLNKLDGTSELEAMILEAVIDPKKIVD
ncbi:MAG: hypothetical protein K0U06_01270 [Gammaproteobacteria bacterium]|nr:hypothetical protein [Gammaproteobacteria bacterium]MCH9842882.1 hypothetical protein [Gammaproteobacteria bacterium]MDC0412133.1 hypothetical protein [Porticoccus sp.]MDC1093552.1 hypothetical protein [Porticoccus sp.]